MNEQFFDSDSFTPRARELVKNAVTLAGSWGHTYIGTEHILLSAAYEEDSTAVQCFCATRSRLRG